MTEIFFYQLLSSSAEQTIQELAEKARTKGWRVSICIESAEVLDDVDSALWNGPPTQFLAHGRSNHNHNCDQPILLSDELELDEVREFLVLVTNKALPFEKLGSFERVCLIFDSNDEVSLENARKCWKSTMEKGYQAAFFSQESGRWREKARSN